MAPKPSFVGKMPGRGARAASSDAFKRAGSQGPDEASEVKKQRVGDAPDNGQDPKYAHLLAAAVAHTGRPRSPTPAMASPPPLPPLGLEGDLPPRSAPLPTPAAPPPPPPTASVPAPPPAVILGMELGVIRSRA